MLSKSPSVAVSALSPFIISKYFTVHACPVSSICHCSILALVTRYGVVSIPPVLGGLHSEYSIQKYLRALANNPNAATYRFVYKSRNSSSSNRGLLSRPSLLLAGTSLDTAHRYSTVFQYGFLRLFVLGEMPLAKGWCAIEF